MDEGRVKKPGGPILAIAILLAAAGIGAGVLRLFLSGSGVEGNEKEAVRALDSVATLEKLWRDGDADGNGIADNWTADWSGFHRALAKNGKPANMMSGAIAAADASPLPAGGRMGEALPRSPHAGYWFRSIPVADGYAFAAYPADAASGRRVFIVREDGKIWAKPGAEPPAAWPAKGDEAMTAAGWTLTRP